ncbi:YidB family protein [Mesorhizobium sp. WSM3859]|uniref:YidB family protein n=1 Tax=Mesorhizobium sp. WSM3859 TaxID=2029402 RepID=UPI000BAFC592|nr:YidB family protein [Mesorhizobium sp. WSM3859]PBC10181.1 hypothetical protein CK230_10630 [Mesorhizobium sp. WSM3859]
MANLGRLAVAILGVLAYQNRDKIGELLRGNRDPNNPQGGILDQLSKGVSGTALGDIVDRFRDAGAGSKVDSWVSPGPNQPIEPNEVEAAIDDETLASLSMQTGLSRDELISRITRDLPEAINNLTPNGELPPAGPEDVTLLDQVPPRAAP